MLNFPVAIQKISIEGERSFEKERGREGEREREREALSKFRGIIFVKFNNKVIFSPKLLKAISISQK